MNRNSVGKWIDGIFFCYKEKKKNHKDQPHIDYESDAWGRQLFVVHGCRLMNESQIIDLINRNKGVEV